MIKIERNKSSTYFLPIFDKIVPIKYFNLLKNTYLWYNDFSKPVFCLLYKFDGKVYGEMTHRTGFTIYEQELRDNVNYLGECDYGEFVLYMFSLPEELIELRDTIVRGKYSKIPKDFKKYILEFMTKNYGKSSNYAVKQVLYKREELRVALSESLGMNISKEAELSSIIDVNKELFSNYVIEETNIKTIKNGSKIKKSENWSPWVVTSDKG